MEDSVINESIGITRGDQPDRSTPWLRAAVFLRRMAGEAKRDEEVDNRTLEVFKERQPQLTLGAIREW